MRQLRSVFAATVVAVLLACGVARADSILVDRGLPTANLNNAAGSNRSNVAWGYGPSYPSWFTGDDFTVSGAGQYRVNTLRAWFTVGNLGANALAHNLASLTLYGGTASNITALASANFSGNSTNNANVVVTEVNYSNGQDYQSPSSTLKLWQVEFTNLNWIVNAGELNVFGVRAPVLSGDGLFLHASNAALSGSPQSGSDGSYRALNDTGSQINSYLSTSAGNGWDKASDINVQIEGAAVPLPAAVWAGLALMGGLAAKRGVRRRNA